MVNRRSAAQAAALIAALLACGCSHVATLGNDPDLFRTNPDQAKVIFYAYYDDPEDEPSFGEAFRLHIDGGYIGDAGDDEFITSAVTPGEHVVDVDELGWEGTVRNHSSFKQSVKAGEIAFVGERIARDGKAYLSNKDRSQGGKDIMLRKRVCIC